MNEDNQAALDEAYEDGYQQGQADMELEMSDEIDRMQEQIDELEAEKQDLIYEIREIGERDE